MREHPDKASVTMATKLNRLVGNELEATGDEETYSDDKKLAKSYLEASKTRSIPAPFDEND